MKFDNCAEGKPLSLEEYLSRDLATLIANNENLDIVYPKPNELQLDLDTELAVDFAMKVNYKLSSELNYYLPYTTTISKGGNTHMTIQFPFDLNSWQRIALQACYGSDLVRELLSCMRLLLNIEHPTLFFETKKEEKCRD